MASPTIDPLIRIKPSQKLMKIVPYLVESENKKAGDSNTVPPAAISSFLTQPANSASNFTFSIEDIKWIYDRKDMLKDIHTKVSDRREMDWIRNIHFHELLSECEIILPEPKFPPRDPVLEARCQKLRAQQQAMEYRRMTSNVDGTIQGLHKESDTDSFSKQMKEINNYLIIVAQLVISIMCSFAFGYLAPYYFYQTTEVGPRLLSGIIFAFVVGLADLYFVIKFLLETEGVIVGDTIKSYDKSVRNPIPNKLKTN